MSLDGGRAHLRNALSQSRSYLGVGGGLIVLIAILAASSEDFLTTGNVLIILETNAVLLVASLGLTFVLLVGGFDLSLGAMLAASGVLLAFFLNNNFPALVAVLLVVVAMSFVGGVINGVLIARVGLSFFVVTLGSASLIRGTALLKTDGTSQTLFDESFIRELGQGRIGEIPVPVIIALCVFVVAHYVSRRLGYGHMVYVVGGNPDAARLAGINPTAIRISAYAIAAGLTGLAGVMESGRLATASPTLGVGFELKAGAAVLLGGTSFVGGSGGMTGTVLGVLFLGTLSNGLTITGVSSFWQGFVTGLVLILAVLLDRVPLSRFVRLPSLPRLTPSEETP